MNTSSQTKHQSNKIDSIRNIIFDIGNVLVNWSPELIVARTFDDSYDHNKLIENIFKSDLWLQLNK